MSNDLSISQNFLTDKDLILNIINKAGLDTQVPVIDIGAGKGAICLELSKSFKKVIAYELDRELASALKENLFRSGILNIDLRNENFLESKLPDEPFNVFANIPFSISAQIIRKLLLGDSSILNCVLFLEKGTAYRFMGLPQKEESIISLSIKLNYSTSLIHQFRPQDFKPKPRADIVLVRFSKRTQPLLPLSSQQGFIRFLTRIFDARKHDLKGALLSVFTFRQLQRIKTDLKLDLKITQSQLTIDKWLLIYDIALSLKVAGE